jgi:hypothetical protein
MLMRDAAVVRKRITEEVAKARIAPIDTPIFVHGRDRDELQGIFRVSYDLLAEMGKVSKWATYDHDEHGFIYVKRDANGQYSPDELQVRAVRDSLDFFDQYMRPGHS